MNLFNKIDKLSHYYSFNIFAFSSVFATLLSVGLLCYPSFLTVLVNLSSSMDCKFLIVYIIWNIFFLTILSIALIVFLFEKVFSFPIQQKFFLNNKYIKYLRYLGTFISLTFTLILILIFLLYFINNVLIPNDLVHYDINN